MLCVILELYMELERFAEEEWVYHAVEASKSTLEGEWLEDLLVTKPQVFKEVSVLLSHDLIR